MSSTRLVNAGLDRLHTWVLLQDLAGYVERQVIGIKHALYESEVEGQELLGVIHDKRALHVQL